MDMVSIFTANLRYYLQVHDENGRTFSDICRTGPFPKGTLGTLVSGRVDNPTYNTAYKLAKSLWLPMEAFAVRTKAEREGHAKSIIARFKEERGGQRRRRQPAGGTSTDQRASSAAVLRTNER